MEAPTIIVKTPISEIEVELFKWITGRKADYADEPVLSAVKLGGLSSAIMGGGDLSVNNIDTKAIQEGTRRGVEVYTKRVGTETDPKKCIELILDLPEEDYKFIQKEIEKIKEESKKKLPA